MKKVFRHQHADNYWDKRWENAGIDSNSFENEKIYPVKYINELLDELWKSGDRDPLMLEAGCGSGRVYFHYKAKGNNIKAFDYSDTAVTGILKAVPDADVIRADICNLPYNNESFNIVMAFGLFHSIEDLGEIVKGFIECERVLKKDGYLLFSVRLNGLENDIIDYRSKTLYKRKNGASAFSSFHKWQFDPDDVGDLCEKAGFEIVKMQFAKNVSFLFKWEFFKSIKNKSRRFSETRARSNGFKLNFLGTIIDKLLNWLWPRHFSNLIVVTAMKKR